MLNILFFSCNICYLFSTIFQFIYIIFKFNKSRNAAWYVFIAGFILQTVYMLTRGIIAKRLPLSNQFEFSCGLAWGISLLYIVLHLRLKKDFLGVVTMPIVFLVVSYASLLPKEINDLMPALRSSWFGLHIGSAVFSYAGFAIAAGLGVKYIILKKNGENIESDNMIQIDFLSYRLIAFGFLLLTVVILSGCVWAEQAWSAFWTWDPKETWALISWIIYAIYLHLRLKRGWQGEKLAYYSLAAFICVIFAFIGVNQLLPGLHSYK